jgi:hypothetical protein
VEVAVVQEMVTPFIQEHQVVLVAEAEEEKVLQPQVEQEYQVKEIVEEQDNLEVVKVQELVAVVQVLQVQMVLQMLQVMEVQEQFLQLQEHQSHMQEAVVDLGFALVVQQVLEVQAAEELLV